MSQEAYISEEPPEKVGELVDIKFLHMKFVLLPGYELVRGGNHEQPFRLQKPFYLRQKKALLL
ncbi:MAG: hypothetical protein M0Z58_10155, partial [Nitrospiraceae bacterium]|nr:hypothetical protein [Nitrospiraceae bacterium]